MVQPLRMEVWACCLMPNHFHLYLCTPEGNFSRYMQGLLSSVWAATASCAGASRGWRSSCARADKCK